MELSTYFLFGCMWVMTLEWLSTSNIENDPNILPWGWRERFINFVLWPITFLLFIWRIIQQMMDDDDDNNLGF